MVTPIPTFPNQSPSTASFYGSLSKLFLYDSRGVGLTFAFWKPEPLPVSFAGAQGSKVYFKPGTAAVSFPAAPSPGGTSYQAELTFETTDDSPEVFAWLTSLLALPLFALAYPVGAGLIRGFQSLQLTFEYKNTGKYEDAPRYLVSLKSKGLVKIWYLSSGASSGHVLPYDPDDSNSVEPNLNAFDEGFDEGFIKP